MTDNELYHYGVKGMKVVNYNKDRKLRAYYGHTSNY